MAGERIIDPSDPNSLIKMLARIAKLEKQMSSVSADHRAVKKRVNALANTPTGSSCSNVQFNATNATTVTYSSGYVKNQNGATYQVTGGTLTIPSPSTNKNLYAMYNPSHKQMFLVAADTDVQSALVNQANIYVAGLRFTAFNVPLPATVSTYPNGTAFGLA